MMKSGKIILAVKDSINTIPYLKGLYLKRYRFLSHHFFFLSFMR